MNTSYIPPGSTCQMLSKVPILTNQPPLPLPLLLLLRKKMTPPHSFTIKNMLWIHYCLLDVGQCFDCPFDPMVICAVILLHTFLPVPSAPWTAPPCAQQGSSSSSETPLVDFDTPSAPFWHMPKPSSRKS